MAIDYTGINCKMIRYSNETFNMKSKDGITIEGPNIIQLEFVIDAETKQPLLLLNFRGGIVVEDDGNNKTRSVLASLFFLLIAAGLNKQLPMFLNALACIIDDNIALPMTTTHFVVIWNGYDMQWTLPELAATNKIPANDVQFSIEGAALASILYIVVELTHESANLGLLTALDKLCQYQCALMLQKIVLRRDPL